MSILIRAADVAPQRWKNGGGTTRELLARPAGDGWQMRVSLAEIEADGLFSVFAGTQRWFAVLEGAGVELAVDGRPQRIERDAAPFEFSGAAVTTCRLLAGPTRDLNLMLRGVAGRLLPVADATPWCPTLSRCGLFSAVAGRCEVRQRDAADATSALPAHALLWFDRSPASLRFVSDDGPAGRIGWWLEAAAAA